MSDPDTPEYKALFEENEAKIQANMAGLFYATEPASDNKWAKLTPENLADSVKSMNGEYLRKVLLGTDTKEEKEYLGKLEKELARRIKLAAEEKEAPAITSLFGNADGKK